MAVKDAKTADSRLARFRIHPQVFGFSAGLIFLFVTLTLFNLDRAEDVFAQLKTDVTATFGWFLIFCTQAFLVFALYLAASRFGHIRLGGPDARKTNARLPSFAMLVSAGMGIGLMF